MSKKKGIVETHDGLVKSKLMAEVTSLRMFVEETMPSRIPDNEVLLVMPEWMVDFPVLRCGDHVLLLFGPTILEIDKAIADGIYAVALGDLSPSKQLRVKKIRDSVLRLLDVNDLSEIGEVRPVCPHCGQPMTKCDTEDGPARPGTWVCACECARSEC